MPPPPLFGTNAFSAPLFPSDDPIGGNIRTRRKQTKSAPCAKAYAFPSAKAFPSATRIIAVHRPKTPLPHAAERRLCPTKKRHLLPCAAGCCHAWISSAAAHRRTPHRSALPSTVLPPQRAAHCHQRPLCDFCFLYSKIEYFHTPLVLLPRFVLQ